MVNEKTMNESIREKVKMFVEQELSYEGADFDPAGDLIEQGVIDSMTLVRLASYLEETFQIEIPDAQLVPANFCTLAAIEALVERSRRQKAE
jgi:acyl carrier protein